MSIGFQSTIAGLAIGSALSPKIGAVTGYLTGLTTGRLFGDKSMPTLLQANGVPIRVSVITNTAHNATAEPTELTIENGAQLSDHVILKPKTVTISFEVSNIEDENRDVANISAEWTLDGEVTKVGNILTKNDLIPTQKQFSDTLTRFNPLGRLGKAPKRGKVAESVMVQLVDTMNSRTPITLNTLHYTYNNMVITSIDASEPAPYKGKLEFVVSLTEVIRVRLRQSGRQNAKVAGAAPQKGVNWVPEDPVKGQKEPK
jgi:hypothetical protein